MPRAQSISPAILILGLNFLLLGKHKYLLPLSFLYVWMYDAFPHIFVVTVVYIIAFRLVEGRFNLSPLDYVIAGVILGLLVNPYFPKNFVFSVRCIFPKLLDTDAVRVGNECYPYDTGQLLENSPLALLAFVSGIVALGLRGRRMDTRTATALILLIFFGFMLFQSRRFIEYFPPFALIFTSFAWAPLLSGGSNQIEPMDEVGNIGDFVSIGNRLMDWLKILFIPATLALVIIVGMWFTLKNVRTSIQDSKPANRYADATDWLIQNTPQNAFIFQTDWDDFPRLFFHDTWNQYLIGFDPTFLQMKNAQLYDQWMDITRGKVKEPSKAIYDTFFSDYVLTELMHENFIQQAGNDPVMREVFKDEEAIVYRVNSKLGD